MAETVVERRAVAMYPEEWAIVERYAAILAEPHGRTNVSATLRAIVREWKIAEGSKLAEMEQHEAHL